MVDHAASKRRAVLRKLENLERAGIEQLGSTVSRTAPPAAPPTDLPADPSLETASEDRGDRQAGSPGRGNIGAVRAAEATGSGPSGLERASGILEQLAVEVAACTRCTELAGGRTQTVFGVGNPSARLCFLGEAPGADEDRQGEPFVGRAGRLLDKILAACSLRRDEVYILNVLKCRPPGNRNPTPTEAASCRPFLDQQLDILRPEFVCCLGTIAAQNLLATTETIGRLRGRFHAYGDIRVVCTYHPAYLLRNPSAKRQVWDDMKMLMHAMGVEVA